MDEITLWMALTVIASEDQKFPTHWGFDVAAIQLDIRASAALL
ncbi:monofunctional biosynthetic peptidoglycan transglycosylase domain protein [Candidatus Erwinia dacicola]|uniref:Monofunctional biosynthetic peptidoglycan transglycosylase domain protein n=1 Tax=Candidatus Erwinia dacicola TaxID=252393 RepID=A0A328TPN5_9GAMM|nr:monofunctional biosynthetic peptidoglycan transglycosylase domain protein [Candidatus Erwinia dacicola]